MSMHIDGKKITEMYWGGLKIREAWYEGERVFSGKPVEVMPATPGRADARDWLRAKLTEYGESYETVKELPFDIDASRATGLAALFDGCSSLTTVPEMDTSSVTDMFAMFQQCHSLTEVPEMDTSSVTSMRTMFQHCRALTEVPPMDTSSVTDMSYMFYTCSSLTTVPDMDTSQVTSMRQMFHTCSSLTTVPDMDTSQVTDMREMFRNCSSLTDWNVRLIGKRRGVDTLRMIRNSGLTREPFYNSSGQPI